MGLRAELIHTGMAPGSLTVLLYEETLGALLLPPGYA